MDIYYIWAMLVRSVFALFIFSALCLKAAGPWNKFKNRFLPPADSVIGSFNTDFIDPLLDQATIRYYANLKSNNLVFAHDQTSFNNYKTNSLVKYGLGFGYRWIIVNWAFLAPHQAYKEEERGRTKSIDMQVNIYGYQLMSDFRLLYHQGYYLQNTSDVINTWQNNQKELQRPDVKNLSLGGNLRYQFNNKNYSFKAAFDQTQFQKRSAGTTFAGITFGYASVKKNKDEAFLLSNNKSFNFDNFENTTFGLGAGFSQTLVYKKNWFCTLTAEAYYQASFLINHSTHEDLKSLFSVPTGILRAAAAYNSPKNYFGINALIDMQPYISNNDISLYHVYSNVKLIYARRFNVEKIPLFNRIISKN